MSINTNPHYEKLYQCSLRHGNAVLTISAPCGVVSPEDALDIREWLEIVLRQVNKWEKAPKVEQHEQAESGK